MINEPPRALSCPLRLPKCRAGRRLNPGNAVRLLRPRWDAAETGIVIRRRLWWRVTVRWTSGDTSTVWTRSVRRIERVPPLRPWGGGTRAALAQILADLRESGDDVLLWQIDLTGGSQTASWRDDDRGKG